MISKIGNFFRICFLYLLSSMSFILKIIFFFPAVFVLEFPFWLTLLVIGFISFVPVFGSIVNIVLWIWAFIVVLGLPLSTLSIIFYILFALNAFDFIQAVIRAFIQK